MARARNIKPSLFKNEILGTADPLYTILFEGLWVLADREGRLENRPLRIKAEIFPYREGLDIVAMLGWLEAKSFIASYKIKGEPFIQILKFVKHQNPHKNEAPSAIASMDEADPIKSEEVPIKSEALALIPDSLNLIPDSRTLDQQADRSTANRFEEFWTAYPRKVGKEDARKAFGKLSPDAGLLAVMLDAVATSAKSEHWAKDKQFIPHPATWIRGKRWQDEEGGSCDDGGIPDYAVGAV